MNLKVVDCSRHVCHSFPSSVPSSNFTHSFTRSSIPRTYETNTILSSNLFASKTLSKCQASNRISRDHSIRQPCSLNLDDIEGFGGSFGEESTCHWGEKMHRAISMSPFPDEHRSYQDFFLLSQYDLLEPVLPGIRPEFLDWPDQDTVMQGTIERKAESFGIPLSLRMIKKKLQREEGLPVSKQLVYCPVKTAFGSMVFIIAELQRYGSHMREALCHKNSNIITSKVQDDTHSSFVWLFQQVFSKTPALMLHLMVLLANFSVYSVYGDIAVAEALPPRTVIESTIDVLPIEVKQTEMNLWISMVEEARKMQRGVECEVLDHKIMQQFVSPVSVKLEPDYDYEDYLGTDRLYQMNLSQEPNSPLLLCNYAQFLHLVAHDHDRAEEYFKQAVQVSPPDAESLNQYAQFLYMVRMDFSGAEEMFLQALSVEPDNSYYVSMYANFLWNTGGEETCFPLDNSSNNPSL